MMTCLSRGSLSQPQLQRALPVLLIKLPNWNLKARFCSSLTACILTLLHSSRKCQVANELGENMRPLIVLVSYSGFGSIAVPPCLLPAIFFSCFFLLFWILCSCVCLLDHRVENYCSVYFLCSKPVSRFCLEHKYCWLKCFTQKDHTVKFVKVLSRCTHRYID